MDNQQAKDNIMMQKNLTLCLFTNKVNFIKHKNWKKKKTGDIIDVFVVAW